MFFGNKTLNQRYGAMSKKLGFFAKFCSKFLTFLCFSSFSAQKMLKMTILTSVWRAQQPNLPNAGLNIQHSTSIINKTGGKRILDIRYPDLFKSGFLIPFKNQRMVQFFGLDHGRHLLFHSWGPGVSSIHVYLFLSMLG